MEEINKLRKLYQLKNVERACSVQGRKESAAEHSWSSLILADYFMNSMKEKLDRLKVYELLMYHDIVEIETGDIPIHHEEERQGKKEAEKEAMIKLKENFPLVMKEKIWELFDEFEEEKTREAKFAKAIDFFDAELHELDYKQDWKGWTEEMLRKYKSSSFAEFPEVEALFEKMMKYCHEEGYFGQ